MSFLGSIDVKKKFENWGKFIFGNSRSLAIFGKPGHGKPKTGTDLFFETGGRLHTAIREDAGVNLAAIGSFSPPGPSPVYRDRFQPR
jgi:hypothetical protein